MKMFLNNNGTNKEFKYSHKKKIYNTILLSILIKSSTKHLINFNINYSLFLSENSSTKTTHENNMTSQSCFT